MVCSSERWCVHLNYLTQLSHRLIHTHSLSLCFSLNYSYCNVPIGYPTGNGQSSNNIKIQMNNEQTIIKFLITKFVKLVKNNVYLLSRLDVNWMAVSLSAFPAKRFTSVTALLSTQSQRALALCPWMWALSLYHEWQCDTSMSWLFEVFESTTHQV